MSEREELERAIAALEAQRAVLGDAVVNLAIAAAREKLAVLEPQPAGQQRKQVTVLFADVSGFTAMSETMDAEDVNDIMNALWERLDKAITEQGGRIDKHMGDAVMAMWGTGEAREDDAERAIRAALAMQEKLAVFREDQPADVTMRIGLNTGLVFLGEVGTTGEYTAIGDTVNLASRLEHAAPVGGILISHDTYRHVRGVFDVHPLEPIQVRGKAKPIQVYVVQRAKPRAFRLATRGVEGIETHMIGRQAELEQLQVAFYTAIKDGRRQMVTITGEAGVGKSRLLVEFDNWIELLPETIRYFKGRASLETQNLPYALIRSLFSFRFQIQDSDRPNVVWKKMERSIEALGRDEQSQMKAHLIGQLLGFDFSASPHVQDISDDARQLRDRALIYLREFFEVTTELAPTVIFLEDIHWADDSSLDAIDHLALTMPHQRLLIVCLARPTLFERRPHWGKEQTFHRLFELQPLSRQDSRRLVEEILQKVERVPVSLRELVIGGAEGNPFYIEELIKMLIEDGVIVKGKEHWHVEPTRLTQIRVPPTLTSVLQARLDSLPQEERTILQQASVVGRKFWDSTVERIGESAERRTGKDEIPNVLSDLQGKEMVFQQDTTAFAGASEYMFKHTVLREVTYESVLKRVRRVYHAIVAEWLIERGGERTGEYTGLIADHLELAEQTTRAATYLRRAGKQAAAQFANAEAVAYLSRALNLIPENDLAGRYDLLLTREKVYDLQGKREAQALDLATLEELADALDDDQRRATVALSRAHYAQVTDDYQATIAAAQAAISLAQAVQDASSEAESHLEWGAALMSQGDYEAAHSQLEQALALAQAAKSRQLEAKSLHRLGNVSLYRGEYAEARTYYGQSIDICRQIGDRRGESGSLSNLGVVYAQQGDYAGASEVYQQALRTYRRIGYRQGEGVALHNLGAISQKRGNLAEARAYFEQTLRLYHEIGDRQGEQIILNNLGVISTQQRDHAVGRDYYEQALDLARQIGDRFSESLTLHNLGNASRYQGDHAGARDYYDQALHIAREIGDRQGEGITLAALGLLHHHLGDDKAALEASQQALHITQDLGNRSGQGYASTHLGHALAEVGHLAEAITAYQQALTLRRELGELHLAVEPLAGLARLSLAQGDLSQAQVQIEEILGYLESGTLEGTEEPFRVYLTCYRVLRANQDPRAQTILNTAHRLLQEQVARIGEERQRQSFLNVTARREILSEFASGKTGHKEPNSFRSGP